jgi:hypothetical protein
LNFLGRTMKLWCGMEQQADTQDHLLQDLDEQDRNFNFEEGHLPLGSYELQPLQLERTNPLRDNFIYDPHSAPHSTSLLDSIPSIHQSMDEENEGASHEFSGDSIEWNDLEPVGTPTERERPGQMDRRLSAQPNGSQNWDQGGRPLQGASEVPVGQFWRPHRLY